MIELLPESRPCPKSLFLISSSSRESWATYPYSSKLASNFSVNHLSKIFDQNFVFRRKMMKGKTWAFVAFLFHRFPFDRQILSNFKNVKFGVKFLSTGYWLVIQSYTFFQFFCFHRLSGSEPLSRGPQVLPLEVHQVPSEKRNNFFLASYW